MAHYYYYYWFSSFSRKNTPSIHQNTKKCNYGFWWHVLDRLQHKYITLHLCLCHCFLVLPRSCQHYLEMLVVLGCFRHNFSVPAFLCRCHREGRTWYRLSKTVELGIIDGKWGLFMVLGVYCAYITNYFCGGIRVCSPTLASGSESLCFISSVQQLLHIVII